MLLLWMGCAEPSCPLWYTDLDGDGYGVGAGVRSCEALEGRSRWAGDCEDGDGDVNPGAADRPRDRIDQDCNGIDACEDAIVVGQIQDVDCAGGAQYVFDGDLDEWPGDCICEVRGDLRLRGEIPVLGPSWVEGDMTIGQRPQGSAEGWYGEGVTALRYVGGSLVIYASGDAEIGLSGLGQDLRIYTEDQATVSLPYLTRLYGSVDLGQSNIQLPGLIQANWISVLEGNGTTDLSMLERVTRLDLDAALDAPQLQSVSQLSLDTPTKVRLPALLNASWIHLDQGQMEAPRLEGVGLLIMDAETLLRAHSLERIQELEIQGTLSSDGLSTLAEASIEADQNWPSLATAGDITIRNATLTTLWLEYAETLVLENAAMQGGLGTVEELRVHGSANTELQLSVAELNRLELDGVDLILAGPTQLIDVEVEERGSLTLPDTRIVELLVVNGAIQAPALTYAGEVYFGGSAIDMPTLRTVETLSTQGCVTLPALRTLPTRVYAGCELDLRTVVNFPKHVEISGEGPFLLPPDPMTSLWIDSSFSQPQLTTARVNGALSIIGALPESIYVEHVTGQLYLRVRGEELGSLTELQSIDKDLRYCAPDIPTDTVNAWIADLQIGGEVLNTCPD